MNEHDKKELKLAREAEADCTIMTGRGSSRGRREPLIVTVPTLLSLVNDQLPEPTETIERAAICYGGVIYSVPRPGRHHNVCRVMSDAGLPNEAMSLKNQGFVTSTGRFVDRYEGARIARAAGQIVREPTPPDMLTSEDVW